MWIVKILFGLLALVDCWNANYPHAIVWTILAWLARRWEGDEGL